MNIEDAKDHGRVQGNELCSFCSKNKAVSMWAAPESNIFCCSACAVYALPSLLADSVFLPKDMQAAEAVIQKATTQFYRSLWHRTRK